MWSEQVPVFLGPGLSVSWPHFQQLLVCVADPCTVTFPRSLNSLPEDYLHARNKQRKRLKNDTELSIFNKADLYNKYKFLCVNTLKT